jgi:uncharacterized protein YkwD
MFFAALVFCLIGCASLLKPEPSTTPNELEQKLFNLVNSERSKTGAAALIWSDSIAAEARTHSKDMAEGTLPFGHDGFADRYARISRLISVRGGAENIAYGPNAETVFLLWLDSSGHKDNIVGDYDFTGVGVAWSGKESTYYFTQIFIRSR